MRIPSSVVPPTIESLPAFQPPASPSASPAPASEGMIQSTFETQSGPDLLGGEKAQASPKEGLQRGVGLKRLLFSQGTASNPALSSDPAAASERLAGKSPEGSPLAKGAGQAEAGTLAKAEGGQAAKAEGRGDTASERATAGEGRSPQGAEASTLRSQGATSEAGGLRDGASLKEAATAGDLKGSGKAALSADGSPLAKGGDASNLGGSGLAQGSTGGTGAAGTAAGNPTGLASDLGGASAGSSTASGSLASGMADATGRGTGGTLSRGLPSGASPTGSAAAFQTKASSSTIQSALLQSLHGPTQAQTSGTSENPRAELRQLFQQWASAREVQIFQSFQAMMPMDAVGFARKMADLVRQGHVPHQDLLGLIAKTLKRPGNRKLISKIKDMLIKKGMVSSSIATEQLELIAAMVALALAKGGSLEAEDLIQDLFDSPSRKLELPDGGGEHHEEGRQQQREEERKDGSDYKKRDSLKG